MPVNKAAAIPSTPGRVEHAEPVLPQPPLVDEARAAWLLRYAETHGFDLSQSYGYGDSHADLVWLELLGNPSAVNPDTNLSREAQRRRWSIHNWKRGSHPTGS